MTSKWRHHPFDFLLNFNKHWPRVYQSDIPNFILIQHNRAEIQSRKVNKELWRKKLILHHCDLVLWPKVTNFNRVWASAVSNRLAKTLSKSVHPFGWNFLNKQTLDTYTNTHTDRHTDKLQWKHNPSTISWRCKLKT